MLLVIFGASLLLVIFFVRNVRFRTMRTFTRRSCKSLECSLLRSLVAAVLRGRVETSRPLLSADACFRTMLVFRIVR